MSYTHHDVRARLWVWWKRARLTEAHWQAYAQVNGRTTETGGGA